MKREYVVIIAVGLYILSYVLDVVGGSILSPIKNPFDLLSQQMLSTYPFTTVSVGFKTLAVVMSILIVLHMIEQKYLAKGAFLIFLSAMMELYSVQQLATSAVNLPVVWSVAISYSGILLLAPAAIYLIIGFAKIVHRNISSSSLDQSSQHQS